MDQKLSFTKDVSDYNNFCLIYGNLARIKGIVDENGKNNIKKSIINMTPQKFQIQKDLKILIIWTILTDIFVLTPVFNESFLRIILAWVLILFVPGYVFTAYLFPEKDDLGNIERIALSVGLSAAIVPILGLFLNFTPFGIRLVPILIILNFFIIFFIILSNRKLRKIKENAFDYEFNKIDFVHEIFKILNLKSNGNLNAEVLRVAMIISIIFFVFTLIYVVSVPKEPEKFTEFYILNKDNNANWYPTNLTLGESAVIKVYVHNLEYGVERYVILIKFNEKEMEEKEILLRHNETWSNEIVFTPKERGKNNKLELILYKLKDTKEGLKKEEYRKLHLWIDVK